MKRNDYEMILPDQLFPTDNDLEIPTLDIDMQAKECQTPFLCLASREEPLIFTELALYTSIPMITASQLSTSTLKRYCSIILPLSLNRIFRSITKCQYLSAYRQYTRSVGLPVVCKVKVLVYS